MGMVIVIVIVVMMVMVMGTEMLWYLGWGILLFIAIFFCRVFVESLRDPLHQTFLKMLLHSFHHWFIWR